MSDSGQTGGDFQNRAQLVALPESIDCGQRVSAYLAAATERAKAERAAETGLSQAIFSAENEHQKTVSSITRNVQKFREGIEEEKGRLLAEAGAVLERLTSEMEATATAKLKEARSRLMQQVRGFEKERDEKFWHASTAADSRRTGVETEFNNLRKIKNEMTARLEQLAADWQKVGARWPEGQETNAARPASQKSLPVFATIENSPDLKPLENRLVALELQGRRLVKFLPRLLFRLPLVPIWAALGGGAGFFAGIDPIWPAVGGGVLAIIGHFLGQLAFKKKAAEAIAAWDGIQAELDTLDDELLYWRDTAKKAVEQQLEEQRESIGEPCERQTRLATVDFESAQDEIARDKEASQASSLAKYDDDLRQIESTAASKVTKLANKLQESMQQAEQTLEQQKKTALAEHATAWAKLRTDWKNLSTALSAEITGWHNWRELLAPKAWPSLDLAKAGKARAGGVALGEVSVSREAFPDLVSGDAEVRQATVSLDNLPLIRPLPGPKSTLWIQSPPGRRAKMYALLQNIVLRTLASFPPGEVRFTLVDPVGLGQTFASLLHLGDFEPSLVNQRPWSEARDIEARLAELTAHLEFVVQNYLRNQYQTIQDYNADAGEVAEAYRVLVLADYPQGISDESARRLRRLIEAGSRCGIYVIIGHDLSQPGAIDPNQNELRSQIDRIVWSGDKSRWSWVNHPLDRFDPKWDTPPDADTATKLVRDIGARAKQAMRVEVPFSVVAPADGSIWTQSTARGVDIPLGRAGARQLQSLRLGEGTSQHVILAGRTGSGKSTLLHAIVTNAALRFSPDELELYLIDFKKGVEFKNYATRNLPHARVVAVESEREFGLSVLEKLDRELTDRGERFRRAGVQDVAGFRANVQGEPLPRILLVVDEFQELFNEDDRISSDSASLLDRLVRQGRAFGIHAILGSQSMAGAYAIARSTMGQMGVRIALQCNENDSRLILSEDNPAARLLSRPGEAIYNDANGLVEGNHLFQAVWISDSDREKRLAAIHQTASERGWRRPEPMIVFEGQASGELARNKQLLQALAVRESLASTAIPCFWPGETVTISDPPPVKFAREAGANLLVVGRQGPDVRAMLASGLLGVAATSRTASVKIAESPTAGETSLFDLVKELPIDVQRIAPASLKSELTEIWNQLHARQDDPSAAETPLVFVINDIARLRDLRKSDDDYGFGGFGGGAPAPPSTTKMVYEILRDGPPVGIHTIFWTDSAISMQNCTERNAINEFGTIVIYQTTAADSTHFLDNNGATKLQRWQALFVRPVESETIKIRPYGLLDNAQWQQWLGRMK
ncbi:MAG: FtsK/SpoIIIE domain-containing protein [Isosphaeraceae bacterium]